MAAVAGDFVSDLSRFHTMVSSSSPLQQQQPSQQSPDSAHYHHSPVASPDSRHDYSSAALAKISSHHSPAAGRVASSSPSTGASRFPSPPSSSSPTATRNTDTSRAPDHAKAESMAPQIRDTLPQGPQSATLTQPPPVSRPQQPSPPSDDASFPSTTQTSMSNLTSQATTAATANTHITTPQALSQPDQPVIHIRDLEHIQSLVRDKVLGDSATTSTAPSVQTKYEISQMPIGDVIEMVAALLTKITTTNDLQHDALQRNATHQQQASLSHDSSSSSHMSPLSHSVLAFHGKNVPAITIHSYLSRIHKYCPTTYEVFLSLLVYFDRMTERVNDLVVKSEAVRQRATRSQTSRSTSQSDIAMSDGETTTTDDVSHESDSDLADDDDDDDDAAMAEGAMSPRRSGRVITVPDERPSVHGPATYFVVDSFNIHRLIIAGVTCASKFFSDVFYTNSRYAKVGGLPQPELNHLEIQFLVLNDFRLAIPVEDLEGYGTMLVEFYAREVVAKNAA